VSPKYAWSLPKPWPLFPHLTEPIIMSILPHTVLLQLQSSAK
jgi:hypothetical protein